MLMCTAALALLALAGSARADEEARQCLREARSQAQFCRAECRENYQMDKDQCLDVDHACAEECRAERNECLVDIYSDLDTCHAPCDTNLAEALTKCQVNWPPRTEARVRCVKVAKLRAYRCTAECRVGVRDEIKECRTDHRQCMHECPGEPAAGD